MSWTERIEGLPTGPGVYRFRNARGRVLYVGKAQNLRARVRAYAAPGGDGRARIGRLVEQIADVDVVVTPSVKDALLLENELIKRHRPPYNVRLRDDKQYLALRLDPREPWPRLVPVRRFRDDGALYFGPYTSSAAMRAAISNLRRIFPLRSCTDAVFRDYARRGRPCIEHEMGRCLAPCVGRVGEGAYAELVEGTTLFLRGRSDELVDELRARMAEAAAAERFEEAARLRDRIAAVEATVARQQIVTPRAEDRDVFGVARRGGELEVHALHVRGGRVVGTSSFSFSGVEIDEAEALGSFLGQYYADPERPVPREVVAAPEPPEREALEALLAERAGRRVRVRTPRRGALRELVAMAEANATVALEQRLAARETVEGALRDLAERLDLPAPPRRIECYDVSTLAGTHSVASRVVFENGQPDKSAYRRYRIRLAPGDDDLACLREVMTRRLARVGTEPLPDLLMVDGGRGQVGVVRAALEDAGLEAAVLGLAKERDTASPSPRVRRGGGLKSERIFRPGRKDAITLPPSSPALLLLQRIRDEAHRFAIEFQRSLRRRASLRSLLEEIPGIGPGKRRALLRELGSLKAIRAASQDDLARVPGISRRDAEVVRGFLDHLDGEEPASPPGGPPRGE